MKTQYQVLSFLSQYTPGSDLDREMITAFLEKRYRITPTTPIFATQSQNSLITVQLFHQWYESGYTASQMVKYDNQAVILGICTLEEATVIGKLEDDIVKPCSQVIKTSGLANLSPEEQTIFLTALWHSKLQYNPTTFTLEAKYIPELGKKVFFHSYDFGTTGTGIVRDIDTSNLDVEFYCYFIYPTRNEKSKLGCSMHERNIANLRDYIFEPLLESEDKNHNRFSTEDGISAYRRLKRELEKTGKIWRDKLYRVEPSQMKLEKGGVYWYISDKLKVVQERDKGTPTAQIRYLCGNYFVDYDAALVALNKIYEMIRNYLASSQWPKLEN